MCDGENHRRQPPPSLDLKNLKVISVVGRGAKGVVFLARSSDGESFALKAVLRSSLEKDATSHSNKKKADNDDANATTGEYRRSRYYVEEDVLASLNHPLLPKLRGLLQTDQIIGYAIDYCPGRDLNSLRKKQTEKMFSDDIIRFYAAEIVLALEYLHGMGIVYRDLKPENVMIQETGHLMLVDFDLSTKLAPRTPRSSPEPLPASDSRRRRRRKTKNAVSSPLSIFCNSGIITESDSVHPAELIPDPPSHEGPLEKSKSFVGTEEYVAPEIISGVGHDFSVDWWCLGVMLHEMLYGTTPFKGENRKETFYRVLVKTPELVGQPTPLRDLIRRLLVKDPGKRISLEEIKGHDFFKNVDWDRILEIARPPFIPAVEDVEENKLIDVESFVEEVFRVVDDDEKNRE